MTNVISSLIAALLKSLKPEHVKVAVDAFLDVIEKKCVESKTQIDDTLVLPICATIRAALNVPDND